MKIMRYEKNPILTKENVPFNVNAIFNPGAVKFNNKYLLISRVEMPTGRSSFVRAWSDNGYDFTVEDKPCLTPADHKEFSKYTEWGIEDPRITKIGDTYYLTYTGYSKYMPLVMLTETKDFQNFNVLGPISLPSNKDCCLFSEKIDGYYWKIDRPSAEKKMDMWISKSKDLLHWGGYEALAESTPGTWETDKIGASTQPVKTKDGWLMLYHGVRSFGITTLYKVGVMLLDLEKPWIVKGRTPEPILIPELDYERTGDVTNVVFTNGWVVDGNDVNIYYSGADTNICLAKTTVEYLLSCCK